MNIKSFLILSVSIIVFSSCNMPGNNRVSFEQKESYKWMFADSIKDSINQTPGNYSNDHLLFRTFQYQNDFEKFDPGYVINILELKNNSNIFSEKISFDLKNNAVFEFSGGYQTFHSKSNDEFHMSDFMKHLKSLRIAGQVDKDTIIHSDYYHGFMGNSSLINVLDSNSDLKIQLLNRSKNNKTGLFLCKKGTSLFLVKFSSEKPFDEKLFDLINWKKFDRLN